MLYIIPSDSGGAEHAVNSPMSTGPNVKLNDGNING